MNCPSRNDEDAWLHPDWNQSPPHFAADLTTCQDMNGIANARELGQARGLEDGCHNIGHVGFEECFETEREKTRGKPGEGAKSPQTGLRTRYIANNGRSSKATAIAGSRRPATTYQAWAWWLLSVMITSTTISFISNSGLSRIATYVKSLAWYSLKTPTLPKMSTHHHVKRDSCASAGIKVYDLPLHVGALFIILFASATACSFPILVIRFPRLRIPGGFLFSAKHFGTGVLIATSFVHLLPTAFISLGNPCLPKFWTTDYPAMPGAIALAAIFFVTVIEMVFSPAQHACGGGHETLLAVSRESHSHADEQQQVEPKIVARSRSELQRTASAPEDSIQVTGLGILYGRTKSIGRTLSQLGEKNEILDSIESGRSDSANGVRKGETERPVKDVETHSGETTLSAEQARKKAVLQCLLLEMGILFHSIFIGMSLSVSVGSEFVILLIAIIFHQTFEGLALGVRIAAIEWPDRALQPWLMALAYGCTTPLGQAIGIATHTLYTPDSKVGLLVVGIMNAISSGLLIFASLVELLSEELLSDESWRILRGRKRVYACLLVFAGAFCMSLVGAWA
ncbi:ZIP zinc transporter-domain-containing protein [Massariosphaeria phaeospora]|uniref:ZIP zinc transporter-domain-containing protein n=1 Tax=Massariosphaeria phaeospora TaxID=100035 RepID=A0A7C8M3I5_9PLEO|nr:ZIP zinc transporter-domain-containing protein [Massariosphaeria phaeospora]